MDWQNAMTTGKRKALNKSKPSHALRDKLEKLKSSIRAKVEPPFRVIKCHRTSQGALKGVGQEHQPVAGDVCVVELVDGAQTDIAGGAGMSEPAAWAKARKQDSLSPKTGKLCVNSMLFSAC